MNKIKLLAAAIAGFLLFSADAYALKGAWRGSLVIGQMKLPLVFNFSERSSGKTQCSMDSPAQGAKGISVEVVFCSSDSVSLKCSAIGAAFTGRIAGDSIKGQFSQRGYSFPLDLAPEQPLEERRPQTPKPPFPYTSTDTTFTAADGTVMSGTLTIPMTARSTRMPAVVMVTGSGAQNRDEELFDHRPFAVIADYLARNGIASLRYDDRGTGKSGGDFGSATTYTFSDDAKSGIAFLRRIGCIGKVGVLGHSEGGTIAFIIGSEGNADFAVSLAGMAVSGKETLLRQNRHSLNRAIMTETDKNNSLRLIELCFDSIAGQVASGKRDAIDTEAIAAKEGLQVPVQIQSSLKTMQKSRTLWFDTFLTINPREYLGKMKCPLLAINGEKDTQVSPDNLEVIQAFAPQSETHLMPGLNHMLQHAVTGESSEYGEINETISPEVLEVIVNFIKRL